MKKRKRFSWTQVFQPEEHGEAAVQEHLVEMDEALYDLWELGRNIILVGSPCDRGIELLVVPHVAIGDAIAGTDPPVGPQRPGPPEDRLDPLLHRIVAGSKVVSPERMAQAAELFATAPVRVRLPFTPGNDLPLKTVAALIKRYSITLVEDRAVALFDIVGFSLHSPLAQVTLLNSLSYSVNTAYSKLMDQDIEIRFARTNTGDGFYIWNRDRGIHSNVDLYHFMHLVLAENALARNQSCPYAVPTLRTCFHVGGHYEFYQSEGLNPTTFSYIVGDVTIELARMIDQARPGQILIGDFRAPMADSDTTETAAVDSVDFIRRTQARLSSLDRLVLGGNRIQAIKCYLTGGREADGSYRIRRYLLADKHNYTRHVFNAKVNIHRRNGPPIYLGLQDVDLRDFGVSDTGP